MTQKHTPAPWKKGTGGDVLFTHPNGKLYIIANAFSGIKGNATEEQEANARLIAAAPELLEVLREFIDFEKQFTADAVNLAQFISRKLVEENSLKLNGLVGKAQGIIAKAEGR